MKKFITILATLTALTPVLAMASSSWTSLTVTNSNTADVTNIVEVSATTGSNTSDGGVAAMTVLGGGKGSSAGDNNTAGGDGGTIKTGEASATVDVTNLIGSNDTEVTPAETLAGTTSSATEVTVDNANAALLGNLVAASVDTGSNDSTAGDGASTVTGGGEGSDTSGNNTQGGFGGQIETGPSYVHTTITNLLGSNIIRFNPAPTI